MESLDIQAFTYEQRRSLLAGVDLAVTNCGGWILERKTRSDSNVELHVEIQVRVILDLYGALLEAGVEFTRSGYEVLTAFCTRRKHLGLCAGLGQTVAIHLDLSFLDDVSLQSLLGAQPSLA